MDLILNNGMNNCWSVKQIYYIVNNFRLDVEYWLLKSFKFRLYPNKGQEILINKHLGSNRFIYNYFLDKRINTYKETKQILTYNQCSALLPQLKKELEWLKEVDSKSKFGYGISELF